MSYKTKYEVHPQERALRVAIADTISKLPADFVLHNERGHFIERVLNTLYEQVRHRSWGTGRLAPDQLESSVRSALYITLSGCCERQTLRTIALADRRDIEDGVILRFMPELLLPQPTAGVDSLEDLKERQAWLNS